MLSKIKSLFQSKSGDTFIGLIDEDGVGKGSSKDQCTMTFSFCAYINNDGILLENEAVIHKEIPNFDYNIKGLEPLTIVEIRGNQISYHGQNRINLSSVVKTGVHNEKLKKVLEKRLKPVIFESDFFGVFILDRAPNWFEVKAKWIDNEIDLLLSGTLDDLPELELQAITLFNKQNEWDQKFRNKITSDLLELKNESWIEEDENPLTEIEFQGRIKLENLQIHNNGDFQAWYSDGDIFWGHSISLDGNLNGQLDDAGLQG